MHFQRIFYDAKDHLQSLISKFKLAYFSRMIGIQNCLCNDKLNNNLMCFIYTFIACKFATNLSKSPDGHDFDGLISLFG